MHWLELADDAALAGCVPVYGVLVKRESQTLFFFYKVLAGLIQLTGMLRL
jgi:hypothetical protein